MGWKHWLGLPLALAVAACSADEPATSKTTQAISTANSLTTNALASNGVWENGVWENGVWENGVWENGVWENGVWENGVWENGVWENGVWENGVWENGVWENGVWENNLVATQLFETNPYTRQVLQKIYSCAMPKGVEKTLTVGSTSITLKGEIGLAPTWDTVGGTCDETCQRWISACLIARTNAYGVTVDISMRAPANAPDSIKQALAVTDAEMAAYPLREGAFYGNLFATSPPPEGTTGPVTNAPAFFACAGPGSNLPELTKRFNSSQGVGGPIINTGLCEPTDGRAAACASVDPGNGAEANCSAPATAYLPARQYSEVITVYIKQPVEICGNGVCELNEQLSCPSDCHPGTWTRTFDQVVNPAFTGSPKALPISGVSALSSADQSVVVIGEALSSETLDLGRLNDVGLPDPFVGSGNSWQLVIAKYSQAGQYIKAVRYVPFTRVIPGAVAYDKNGNIGVIGQSVQNPGQIWIGMFDANLDIMPGWPRALGGTAQAQLSGFTGLNGRAQITFDAAGNLIASGEYQGTASFAKFEGAATNDTTVFTSVDAAQQPTTCCGALDVFVVKLAPNGFVTWARSFGASGGDRNNSLAIDGAGDVILTTAGEARVRKLSGATGDALWSRAIPNDNSSAVPDPTTGDVFVTGAIRQFAFDFGGTSLIAPSGADVYLARYAAATGALQWAKSANSAHTPPGFTYAIGGYLAIGDHGLVVGGEMLDQFNGRIDFGSGWFPTYASNDLFLAGYDFDGTFQWAKHVSLVLDGHFSSMQVVADRLAMSGTFSGSMYVDDRLLPNAIPELTHYSNAFVASFKLPQPGDVLPPLVDNLSQPIVVQATSSGGAKVWFMAPTAIDTGYAGTSVVCDPPPNSLFSVGITIVTCTATDPFGNATVATFPITVKDNYGPTFTGVVPITVQSPSGTAVIVNYALPVATDQVSGPATVSCSPPPGTAFPVGTTEVTCYAIDNAGNRSTVTFPVTVESPLDVMPPLIVAPADYTVEATSSGGAVVTYPVTATDDGGPVTIVCTPPLGSTLPLGTTTVTCTATDAAGNSSTLSFNVTVEDHSAPTLYAPTDPVVVSASAGGTVVTYSVSATDTVDSSVTTVCTPPSGSTFSLGTTSVTCTATDDAGNTTTKTFLVRVVAEWTGILQPINADGSSVFKLGNVVPVKFKLSGSSAGIATLTATLTLVKVSSSPTGTDIEAISVGSADSGNTFRYDPVNDIYIFNLATTTLSVGTWQLRIDLGDGVIHTVNISLKK